MYLSAIVLAAGKGERFRSRLPKPVVRLNSQPVIIYSLDILNRHPLVKEIILVVSSLNRRKIVEAIKKYRILKITRIVEGGARRQDSVYHGLKAIDKKADLVLIHDAGRPFIDRKAVDSAVKAAYKYGAAITGVPVKVTIKKARGYRVEKTIDRSNLWEIQTPQVFRKDIILKAFQKFGRQDVTDDAMLVEKLGQPVVVVPGTYCNIKITTPEDLIIAEAILKKGRGLFL